MTVPIFPAPPETTEGEAVVDGGVGDSTAETCLVLGCTSQRYWGAEGRCTRHYTEFCRRAGTFRVEGFPQDFADLLAAAGFSVVGRWPVQDGVTL